MEGPRGALEGLCPARFAEAGIKQTTEERAAILSAYAQAHGNKSRVAEMLGVSRKTLYARLKRLDLELS